MRTHKDLKVWQNSIKLVTTIYTVTNSFPREELFGLTSQIRRAAVSIPSNIAEGAARRSKKEFTQFLYIALGSQQELDTQLIISYNLRYIDSNMYNSISTELNTLGKMIMGLINSNKNQMTSH